MERDSEFQGFWISDICLNTVSLMNRFNVCVVVVVRTPLMLAVLGGHTDCVYLLLSKGASVEARDKWGRTALHRGVSHTPLTNCGLDLKKTKWSKK